MTAATAAAAVPPPPPGAGIVLAAALAAVAVLGRTETARARAMLAALIVTPVLLVADIWSTPQIEALRDEPSVALAALGAGLVVVCVLAAVFARRPGLFAVLAVA